MDSPNLSHSKLIAPGWCGGMDLNNNPRIWAENRFKLLRKRREKILKYKGGLSLIFYGGVVSSASVKPQYKKAPRLIYEIDLELRVVTKFLNAFPRP